MNVAAEIYDGDEDGEWGTVEVEAAPNGVSLHFHLNDKAVASAYFDTFQLGILVGQLTQAGSSLEVPS